MGKLALRKHIKDKIKRLKITYVVTGPYFDMWLYTTPGCEQAGGFVIDEKKEKGGNKAYVIVGDDEQRAEKVDGQDKWVKEVGFCTMWE